MTPSADTERDKTHRVPRREEEAMRAWDRDHVRASGLQKAVKRAAVRAGLDKQELLGYAEVKTTESAWLPWHA